MSPWIYSGVLQDLGIRAERFKPRQLHPKGMDQTSFLHRRPSSSGRFLPGGHHDFRSQRILTSTLVEIPDHVSQKDGGSVGG